MVSHDEDNDARTDPYKNPLDRYAQLPEYTRRCFESLDKEDIITLIDILKAYQRAATVGWFFKWLVVGMVGLFLATVTLGEGIIKAYALFANWFK